jgi:protein-tyrosine kinase
MTLPDKHLLSVAANGDKNKENFIGGLLVRAGKLTPAQVDQVLQGQKDSGLLFGDEAIRLGFVRPRDVEQALARQFEYPHVVAGQSKVRREVVAAYSPLSAEVETFRAIRGQLMLSWFGGQDDRKAIAIASPARGDGRSYVAANLAVVFAQLGERTLLVDADMRNARQHDLFGVSNAIGLSSVLSGRVGAEAIVKLQDLVDLWLLPAGPTPPNPGDLVARSAFMSQMQHAIRTYDVVIVDTPAGDVGGDARSIAHATRGALLVARKDRTRLDVVRKMTEDLRGASVEVLGALVNEK